MKHLLKIGVVATALAVTACSITGPSVEVKPPSVKVNPVDVEVEGAPPRHCPPGQAKKGRC